MRKELLISTKFDTTEFDKSVETMQKKLKELYAPSDMMRMQQATGQRMQAMGMGGMISQPTMDAYQKGTQQSRRELDTLIKEQAQGQEKLGKMLGQRLEKLKELKNQQKELVKGSQEELEVKQKIFRMEENNLRLREGYKQRDATLNEMLDAKQKMRPQGIERLVNAYQHGGIGGAGRAMGRMLPGIGAVGLIDGAAGLISGAGIIGGQLTNMYREHGYAPQIAQSAMGNAIQGTYGKYVGDIYGRRTAFEQFYSPERSKAAQDALRLNSVNRNADFAGTGFNLMKYGGIGMGAGATAGGGIGALIGSAIPGAGTALGAAAGAGIGGAAGAGIGVGRAFLGGISDPFQRSLLLSGLPFVGGAFAKQYEGLNAQRMMGDFNNSLDAQKKSNPFKLMAGQDYEQNYMRNLQAQRSMGMDNGQFYGGYLGSATSAGFTPEMAMGHSSEVLGAGGSTRMARDSAFGLGLQRGGFNLTNSGSVLGTLSGGIGGSEGSKQATIKILAEGMKLGLDDSKFAEENRRFTQAAAEIVSRSGANTEGDYERISSRFGNFMGENTNKGIDAAKSAYEEYQGISSSTSGPRGVMRAAGFMKDKYLSKLSTIQKTALMQVPEEQLTANNPLVAGAAHEAGTSVDDLVKRLQGVNMGSVSRFAEHDKIGAKLRKSGVDMSRIGDSKYFESLKDEDKHNVFNLLSFEGSELGSGDQRKMISRAANFVGKPEQYGPAVSDKAADFKGQNPEADRMEDNTVKAMAADAGTVLKNFNEMRGSMNEAALTAAKFTDAIRELNAQLLAALQAQDASKTQNILQQLGMIPGIQPQGGKTSR